MPHRCRPIRRHSPLRIHSSDVSSLRPRVGPRRMGDNTFIMNLNSASMTAAGYNHSVDDFDKIYDYASTGNDVARFYDPAANNTFNARPSLSWMYGSGYFNCAGNFENTYTYASTGSEPAFLYGSATNDLFYADSSSKALSRTGFSNYISGLQENEGL